MSTSQSSERKFTSHSKSKDYSNNLQIMKERNSVGRRDSLSRSIDYRYSTFAPVYFEGEDVTPKFLNPYLYEAGKERQISTMDSMTKDGSFLRPKSLSRMDSQKFQQNLLQQKFESEGPVFRKSFVTSGMDDDLFMAGLVKSSEFSEHSKEVSQEESKSLVEKTTVVPVNITLTLQETETICLLDIPTSLAYKDSEEGDAVLEDNRLYESLTKGKGRYRKVFSVAIQTIPVLQKARDSNSQKVKTKPVSTYVSAWEMYDSVQEALTKDISQVDLHERTEPALPNTHKLVLDPSIESFRNAPEEKQLSKILKTTAFLDALLVIERLLGNNCYNAQQKRFKGLSNPDMFRKDIKYEYRLELLWSFENHHTEGKCVTAICFNVHLEDIVGVGYGKYYYNDKGTGGTVMVWNIKNPCQPERTYSYPQPVTAINFSRVDPNLLAIGFYNGDVIVMDVSTRDNNPVKQDRNSSFDPAWALLWYKQGPVEYLLAGFGDGKIIRYDIRGRELQLNQIMQTYTSEGSLKGIEYLKKCESESVSITRLQEVRCLAMHPVDPYTYFTGTDEGVLHRCSTNYYNEHIDLLKAHEGATHFVKFSPFANKLYYTCGDDFRARLWVDGISEPLVTSEPSMFPVLDVDWSPGDPTVIVIIRGREILIYDFFRKMYAPQSITKSPTKCFNTICKFSSSGRCLLIGDMSGSVHVFSLEDMPIPPFFPEDIIALSLRKLLVTKPELLQKLKKLGSLRFDEKLFSKYFNK